MGKKTRPTQVLPARDPPQVERTYRLKVKGWKRHFTQMETNKKAG